MSSISAASPLILASGSRYRASLIARLGLPFVALPSDADEARLPGETPLLLAERLATAISEGIKQPGKPKPELYILPRNAFPEFARSPRPDDIVTTTRIGISAGAEMELRYYLSGSHHISRK